MSVLYIDVGHLNPSAAMLWTKKVLSKAASLKRKATVVDRLSRVWSDQLAFMRLLHAKRNFPAFPVDVRSKVGQRLIKEIAQDACGEVHEALQHLKNAKLHRATDVADFDRAAFLEELVDAFKLIIEVAILAGVSLDEFFAAYTKKTERNTLRISEEGY